MQKSMSAAELMPAVESVCEASVHGVDDDDDDDDDDDVDSIANLVAESIIPEENIDEAANMTGM